MLSKKAAPVEHSCQMSLIAQRNMSALAWIIVFRVDHTRMESFCLTASKTGRYKEYRYTPVWRTGFHEERREPECIKDTPCQWDPRAEVLMRYAAQQMPRFYVYQTLLNHHQRENIGDDPVLETFRRLPPELRMRVLKFLPSSQGILVHANGVIQCKYTF
jgi:hypothetical protein